MMATSLDEEVSVLESTVRGYHAYMNNWTPVIGQILQVDWEGDNIHDPFAVATSYGASVVVFSAAWWPHCVQDYWETKEIYTTE